MNTPERRKMSRSKILEGAQEILNGGVYGDLTVDALARSLHMSKSTLYKYFASKEDVIVALVDSLCAITDREIDMMDVRGGNARDALSRLMEIQAAHAERMPRAIVLQNTRLPEACQDRVEVTRSRVGAGLRDILVRGIKERCFELSDAALAATALLASAEAAIIAAARGEVARSRSDAVRGVLQLLLPGLGRRVPVAA
jgi:AcrR family transcriptional regulator